MRSVLTRRARPIPRGGGKKCLAGLALVALVSTTYSGAGRYNHGDAERLSPASRTVPSVQGRHQPPARLMGHDWERIPTKKHVVALTFDAGSNAAGLPSIRHTLGARHVPATFFLTGQWVRRYPVKAKALAADYRIGNHSMTHPHFTALTDEQIGTQLFRAARAIRHACDASPRPLFRFPYGDRNERTIAAVNHAGYVAVRWTVDTLGWEGTGSGITVRSIISRVLANLKPGEIVLMHVGANPDDQSTLDADALPRLITKLRARGYSFVTLDALLSAR